MPHSTEVARHFDGLGPIMYDQVVEANGWPANEILRGALRRFLPYSPETTLDLGAATGPTTDVVLQEVQPSRHIAVDAAASMVDWLERRYADDPRVTVEHACVEDYLARTSEHFDLVTAIGLLHFMSDAKAALAGVSHVLNRGKWFALTFDVATPEHPPEQRYDVSVYRRGLYSLIADARWHRLEAVGGRYFAPKPNTDPAYLSHFLIFEKI